MSLFFPSHDIALANGVKHFNPPAAALRLQEDLASLSDIWNEPYLSGACSIPLPWGWDWDTRRYIHEHYDVKMKLLPTDEDLELIRQLSSRRTTISLLEALEQELGDCADDGSTDGISSAMAFNLPQWLDTEQKLFDFIRQHDADGRPFVLKTPWSSSGRGLTTSRMTDRTGRCFDVSRELIMQHARGTLRRMGGIMGEDWIEGKQQDFAMLFFASQTEVRFLGYSLFDNDDAQGGTTYRQGYLLSNDEIVRRLAIDPALLLRVSTAYERILTNLLLPFFGHPWALGYLGIDMMTSIAPEHCQPSLTGRSPSTPSLTGRSPSTLLLHPCIELNLRTTMGVVCRLWHDQHRQDGTFHISPMMQDGHFKAEFLTSQ